MNRMLEALRQIESLSRELPVRVAEPADASEPVEERAAVAEPTDLPTPVEFAPVEFAPVEFCTRVAPPVESVVVEMTPIGPLAEPILAAPCVAKPQVDVKRSADDRHYDDRHYGELAENVLSQLPPDGRAALLFVAAEPGRVEPRMLGALAAVLAKRTGGNVLLVDCDFRRARPADFLGVPTPSPNPTPKHPGLAEVLAGAVRWREAVVDTPGTGVGVLPGSQLPQGLLPEQLEKVDPSGLVVELRKRYPLVLFVGTQPGDPLIDRLTACCYGTYLVVGLGETQRRAAGRAIRSVQRCGGHVLGSIVTDGY